MNCIYNIYCDESCHLENDGKKSMAIGGVWCPLEKSRAISKRIREIKIRHGLNKDFEIKWTKVSPAKINFYLDIVDYFFDDDDLHFRCLIVPDKSVLDHKKFDQNHEDFYYKIYFTMLKVILDPTEKYSIYIDIKDTLGSKRIRNLRKILCNSMLDFDRKIIDKIQLVRSYEVSILQLADLFMGGIMYNFRKLNNSDAKLKIINRIKERSGYDLEKTTLLKENKVNLLVWKPDEQ